MQDQLSTVTYVDGGLTDIQTVVSTAKWYSQVARELQEAGGWHETLQRIVELAVKVAGADFAGLVAPGAPGGPRVLAATDHATAEALVAVKKEAGAAPAWEAILERRTVHSDDLRCEHRWGDYGPLVAYRVGFRTVLAFCLLIDDQPVAALSMYSREPHAFSDEQKELVGAFAEHASIAFDHAAKAEQITTLHVALDHARDIGAAVGIIMDRLHLSQADAFGRLRKVSQDRNRKLSQLAADIVSTGELPFEESA